MFQFHFFKRTCTFLIILMFQSILMDSPQYIAPSGKITWHTKMTYERKSRCVAQIDAPKQNMTPRLPFNHSVLLRVQKRVANRLITL